MKETQYIICDLDGTVADLWHRLHHIQWEKKDYNAFNLDCYLDSVIKETAIVVKSLVATTWAKIIFTSGRSDIAKDMTIKRLADNGFEYDRLIMRKDWNHTPDTLLKLSRYNRHLKDLNILCVFDDRPWVVEMWRNQWLFVFDVNHRWQF
jgi:hypothetical protein